MTDNDKELIKKAQTLHFHDWYIASDLAKKADTEAARRILRRIAIDLYHVEEAWDQNI